MANNFEKFRDKDLRAYAELHEESLSGWGFVEDLAAETFGLFFFIFIILLIFSRAGELSSDFTFWIRVTGIIVGLHVVAIVASWIASAYHNHKLRAVREERNRRAAGGDAFSQ